MEFLIVEAGGLLGGSGKYHPVPTRIARFDSVDRSFQVNVHKDRFKESPSYDREQLSSASYAWAEQVERFFAALRPVRRRLCPSIWRRDTSLEVARRSPA